jgi:hypothetical protein
MLKGYLIIDTFYLLKIVNTSFRFCECEARLSISPPALLFI